MNKLFIINMLYFFSDAVNKTKFKNEGLKNINRAIMNGLRTCGDWNGRSVILQQLDPPVIIENEKSFFQL